MPWIAGQPPLPRMLVVQSAAWEPEVSGTLGGVSSRIAVIRTTSGSATAASVFACVCATLANLVGMR